MELKIERIKFMYWLFTKDISGDYIDNQGNRYIAHSSNAFHTPKGLNVDCPDADTAVEAAKIIGYTYDPLPEEVIEELPELN